MKAITFSRYGGSEVLTVSDVPLPVAGPAEVLVRIRAAGVNPVDIEVRQGALDAVTPAEFPAVPGWDFAGVVEAVGPQVSDLLPGDEVWGFARRDVVRQGTYAGFAAVQVQSVGRRPMSVDAPTAGALPRAGLTALQGLRAARVGSGDIVLVNAAAGGVGHVAVQIARALGARRVIGTASEENRDFVRGLGAEAVDHRGSLEQVVRTLAPAGVDAVLDLHGGPALDAGFALAADPSRVVSTVERRAVQQGGKHIATAPSRADLDQLARWVDDGAVHVQLAMVFPLAQAARAQDTVAGGHVRGKVVLQV